MEFECRKKDDQIAVFAREATETSRVAKAKQNEMIKLVNALEDAQHKSEGVLAGRAELQARITLLQRERDDMVAQAKAQSKAAADLQAEVDHLRRSIADKISQEKLQADVEKGKAAESLAMRAELAELKTKVSTERQKLSGDLVTIRSKLEEVQRLHESLQKAHAVSQQDNRKAQEALVSMASEKQAVDKQKQALQSELADLRARHIQTDKQLAEAITEVQVRKLDLAATSVTDTARSQTSSRQVAAAQAKLADYEDAVMAIEHEKAAWARKLESTSRELASERSAVAKLERDIQVTSAESSQNQAAIEQAHHALAQAKLDIQALDTDIAVLKSRENKTVVEHVHVLEKAKRMTDRELAETRMEKDKLAMMLKSLEGQRSRVGSEHEELVRQHELLKTELRREQQDRKAAQAELARTASSAKATKVLSQEKEDAVSQARTAQAEIDSLQAQLRQLQISVTTSDAPRRAAAGSSRLLQELQLNNEQLRHDMDEQLVRSGKQTGPANEPRSRLQARKSLDVVSAGFKDNDSTSAIKQQLLQLDTHMSAADRIQSHLMMQIEESTFSR